MSHVVEARPARAAVAVTAGAPPARLRPRVSRTPAAGAARIPFWCLMFFTFVLFLAPQLFVPALGPLHLAKTSAGLAALAYIGNRLRTGKPLTVGGPEVRLMVWLTGLALLSIPFSRWPGGSLAFFTGVFIKSVIIFFLIANLLDTVGRLKLLITSIILWGSIVAAMAIENFLVGHVLENSTRIQGYSSVLAGDPNDLALLLNVILSLIIGLLFATRRPAVKGLLLGIGGLVVTGIVVSFSRGGFVTLAVIFVACLAKCVRARGPLVLVPASLLVVVSLVMLPGGYTERLSSLLDPSRDKVGSISHRWQEMQLGLTFMLENPLVGVGLGVDTLAYVERGVGWGWETHNALLQVGADLGIPGLLVYVLLVVQSVRGLRRTQRRLKGSSDGREIVAIATGLELAIYSYVVGAFFLPVPYDFTFYYLAGFAVAVRAIGARLTPAQST